MNFLKNRRDIKEKFTGTTKSPTLVNEDRSLTEMPGKRGTLTQCVPISEPQRSSPRRPRPKQQDVSSLDLQPKNMAVQIRQNENNDNVIASKRRRNESGKQGEDIAETAPTTPSAQTECDQRGARNATSAISRPALNSKDRKDPGNQDDDAVRKTPNVKTSDSANVTKSSVPADVSQDPDATGPKARSLRTRTKDEKSEKEKQLSRKLEEHTSDSSCAPSKLKETPSSSKSAVPGRSVRNRNQPKEKECDTPSNGNRKAIREKVSRSPSPTFHVWPPVNA